MQKVILIFLFSIFSLVGHFDSEMQQNEMRVLSALGDALGRIKELNGMDTLSNLQYPISSLADIEYPIYTDDTAMAILTEHSLCELTEYLAKNDIEISNHFQDFDLAGFHTFLQQQNKEVVFSGTNVEHEVLNVFGLLVAQNYFFYSNYWAQPRRAPGIGCMSAIEGNGLQSLNQDGRPSIKRQMDIEVIGAPFWWNCGAGKTDKTSTGGGNGALMRTYPCAMKFYKNPVFAAALSLVHAHITHSASIGALPTTIFTYGVAQALNKKSFYKKVCWQDVIKYLLDGTRLVGLSNYKNKVDYYYKLGQKDKKLLDICSDKKMTFTQLWDSHFDVPGKLQSNTWTGFGALYAAVYMMSLFVESDNPVQALQWSAHIKGDTDSVGTLVGTFLSILYSIEELAQKESQNLMVCVFKKELLFEKNLQLLEDYQYLCNGELQNILIKYDV